MTALRTFESAARLGTFKGAAEELSVTPAAISHQIKYLEEFIGRRLFERVGKGVVLTKQGEELYRDIHSAFSGINESLQSFLSSCESKVLVLTTFHAFAALWLIPHLDDFYRKHPGVQVKVVIGNDVVDLSRDNSIDMAVRCTTSGYPKLFQTDLGDERFGAYISPGYRDRLAGDAIELITTKWETPTSVKVDWKCWCEQAGLENWLSKATFREFSDEHYALQAALYGQGAVLASTILVEEHVARGTLLPLNPEVTLRGARYMAVCVPGRERHSPVREFLAWLNSMLCGSPMSATQSSRGMVVRDSAAR
ncbi:LysR substrate-binding domain-containing protein [Paraburkholderia bannensis]|uniref:LysR substrate-binding domain-containing protein n=1 Tax=Paraburkholderia bannensis TaxID=765414 RepID=UPI002ABD1880|nr:LysR substrate-binding domain-containing protein [Paraburkholderia bannensis]